MFVTKKFQRSRLWRIQEQIVETLKVVSQERATQLTSEQFEVQMNTSSTSTSEQTVDILILRDVEELGHVGPAEHPFAEARNFHC